MKKFIIYGFAIMLMILFFIAIVYVIFAFCIDVFDINLGEIIKNKLTKGGDNE